MAIALRFNHVEGLRLRQQQAKDVTFSEGANGGVPTKSKDWTFDGADCAQDLDPRKIDIHGKPLPLGTYTVHCAAGLRNVVVEKKGKVEVIQFRNSSLRNQMKIRMQEFRDTGKKDKGGKMIKGWETVKQEYLPANTWGGAFAGDGVRTILDEMPT